MQCQFSKDEVFSTLLSYTEFHYTLQLLVLRADHTFICYTRMENVQFTSTWFMAKYPVEKAGYSYTSSHVVP